MGFLHRAEGTFLKAIPRNRTCGTLALHQSSKNDVEYNLGELSKQIGSVATIPSLSYQPRPGNVYPVHKVLRKVSLGSQG